MGKGMTFTGKKSVEKVAAAIKQSSASWYGQRERKRRKKKKREPENWVPSEVCKACSSYGNFAKCSRCPFFKIADGSRVVFK